MLPKPQGKHQDHLHAVTGFWHKAGVAAPWQHLFVQQQPGQADVEKSKVNHCCKCASSLMRSLHGYAEHL